MAYPIIQAPAVRDAYSVDLMPALGVLQNAQQMQQQQLLMADRLRKEQQAARLQGIGMIGEVVNPLEKGTGFSPLDELHAQKLGEIKQKATEMVMKGGDPAGTYMYLQQATNGLRQRQLDASRAMARSSAWAKELSDRDPALDPYRLEQQGIQNLFYTTDKQGNKVFNPNFDPTADFTQGIDLDSAVDPVKAQQLAAAELPKIFPNRHSVEVPGKTPGILYSAADEVPSYIVPDVGAGKTRYRVTNLQLQTPNGIQQVPVFEDDVLQAAMGGAQTGRYLRRQFKEMRKKLPETISDDDVVRLTVTDFIQTHGAKPGGGLKEDDKEYQRVRQSQKDAEDSFYKRQHLALSYASAEREAERLNMARDKKTAAAIESAVNPYAVTNSYLNRTIGNNQLAVAAASPHMIYKKFNHPELAGQSIRVLDLQNLSGNAYLKDPESGELIKAYALQTADGPRVAIDYYKKAQGGAIVPAKKPTTVLKGPFVDRFKAGVASQLQFNSKQDQKNFNQVIDDGE